MITGSMGSPVAAGVVEIILDGHTIGIGGTFQDALRDAQRRVSTTTG